MCRGGGGGRGQMMVISISFCGERVCVCVWGGGANDGYFHY